jgi:hypothetical protein
MQFTFWDDLDQKRSALSRRAIRRHPSLAHILLTGTQAWQVSPSVTSRFEGEDEHARHVEN